MVAVAEVVVVVDEALVSEQLLVSDTAAALVLVEAAEVVEVDVGLCKVVELLLVVLRMEVGLQEPAQEQGQLEVEYRCLGQAPGVAGTPPEVVFFALGNREHQLSP